jgi:hypothetical protein
MNKGKKIAFVISSRQIDNTPTVYDGARLEPAVRHLVKLARATQGKGDSDG